MSVVPGALLGRDPAARARVPLKAKQRDPYPATTYTLRSSHTPETLKQPYRAAISIVSEKTIALRMPLHP